jgi:hypothetical protein
MALAPVPQHLGVCARRLIQSELPHLLFKMRSEQSGSHGEIPFPSSDLDGCVP